MTELFAGVVGGLGLFIVGMWLLTANLKQLASRRLRDTAHRWTGNRFSAFLWGVLGGGIAQSTPALTFIVVSILRSGLITMKGALAMMLGGSVGVTALVMIATFDIKTVSLYVLGIAGAAAVSERLSKYRPIAASLLGGAMIVLGLVLLKEAATPLADQPWFRDMVEGSGDSLVLAFSIAALLTFIVQSSGAVSVFGIGLATAGVISIDQAIMIIYGSGIGSSAILCVLSANLTGRSRQVAMFLMLYNPLTCIAVVSLLYGEIYFDIPLMKALIFSIDLALPQQLAFVYLIISVLPVPFMLAGLGISGRILERLWPTSRIDELSQTRFIHDHATADIDSSLASVDLEQRRVFAVMSQYFEQVRQHKDVGPLRDASRTVLSEISEHLRDTQGLHPMQGVENRNALMSRQKLLFWLDDALAAMCAALLGLAGRSHLRGLQVSICEGVDGVFLCLVDAMETDDRPSWDLAGRLTGDRGEQMRKMRVQYVEKDPPLQRLDLIDMLLITNSVEEVFFLLSKLEADFNPFSNEVR